MKYLEDFPQTAFFLGIFLFSCSFAYFAFPLKVAMIVSAAVLIVLSAAKIIKTRAKRRILVIVAASTVIVSGVISVCSFDLMGYITSKVVGRTESVTVEITECEYALSYASTYRAKIVSSESLVKGTGILLSSPLTALEDGTVLTGEVTFEKIDDLGSFDAERYYLSQNIRLKAEDVSLTETGFRSRFSVMKLFRELNERLSAMISAHVRYDAAGIASSVLLGNRGELSDSSVRDFRRLGISHLLVISGTHFSVIVTLSEKIMRRLLFRPKKRAVINIVVISLFMLLAGFSPSVVRAGIMHILTQIAILMFRKPNMIHAFALSGAVMVLFSPTCAVDCGMQLSYIATYVCILFLRSRGSLRRFLRTKGLDLSLPRGRFLLKTLETVVLTTMITVTMLPVTWLYFGEVSLISIPANVLFVPAVSVLMYLTGVYLLLYPLKIFIAPLSSILSLYCSFLGSTAEFFSRGEWFMISVDYVFTPFFLIPLAVIMVLLPVFSRETKKVLLLSSGVISLSLISLIGTVMFFDRANTYLAYVPAKDNDGFAVKSDGKALICDISDASYSYLYNLTDEVSAMHLCEIEALMLTHYHSKHVSLLERLAQREILRSVILPEPIDEREEGICSALLESAELYGVSTAMIPVGESYVFGDAVITQLDRTYISRSTHPITAVQIDIGEERTVIVSCSFNQAGEDMTDALESADYAIFGRHSPVYKKASDPDLSEAKAVLVSDNAAEWISEDALSGIAEDVLSVSPESFRMKVSPLFGVSTEVRSGETAS